MPTPIKSLRRCRSVFSFIYILSHLLCREKRQYASIDQFLSLFAAGTPSNIRYNWPFLASISGIGYESGGVMFDSSDEFVKGVIAVG